MLKKIQLQLYPPEWPHGHGDIKKHWHSSGVFIVNFEKKVYTYFIIEFGKVLPAVFTSRYQSTGK